MNGMAPDEAPFTAVNHDSDGKRHLLLAASGSVATIKIPNILNALSKVPSLSIRVLFTPAAARFLDGQADEQPELSSLRSLANVDGLYLDADEWSRPWIRNAPILHIELRRWAHLMVVAPLSANTMAKMVGGICDNLVTEVMRAWDFDARSDRPKKIIVAPAMNTAMWRHPVTARQLRDLEEDWHWVEILRPIEKGLACGDVGSGAMMEWSDIVEVIKERLQSMHGSPPKSHTGQTSKEQLSQTSK